MSLAQDLSQHANGLPTDYSWLADNALEPNLFFEPAMLEAALDHLAPPDVALMIARHPADGMPLAALPVRRMRGRYGPLPTPVPLASWHHAYAMVGTPLVTPESPAAALEALLDVATHRTDGPPVLLLSQLLEQGAVWPLLQAKLKNTQRRFTTLQSVSRAGLRLSPENANALTLRKLIGKKSTQAANASMRKLSALGEVSTLTASTGEQLISALDTFLELEHSSWKGRHGSSLRAIGHDDFARQAILAHRPERVRIDITQLTTSSGLIPIAGTLSLRGGNDSQPIWMPWKTAYDETYIKAAPGSLSLTKLTEALLLQAKSENSGLYLDSLADPRSTIANRLWRHPWVFHDVLIDLTPGGSSSFDTILLAERARLAARASARAARDRIKQATASVRSHFLSR